MKSSLAEAVAAPLPPPGIGRTAERFAALFEFGRADLEVARLAEAHYDAHAIAAEAHRELESGALYGVWAASGPDPLTVVEAPAGTSRQVVAGTVPWCTGVGIVDRALVTAKCAHGAEEHVVLVDLCVADGTVVPTNEPWVAPAFLETNTVTMHFDAPLDDLAVIGERDFYLHRPGFWHGAIGVSACWAGGMRGLFDLHCARWKRNDEHSLAHLGAAHAAVHAMKAVLDVAAAEIDAAPDDVAAAEARARAVRHTIERLCTSAMDELAVGAGPEPLAFDAAIVERTQQLQLYIRQCHGERDLAPLGRHILGRRSPRTAPE